MIPADALLGDANSAIETSRVEIPWSHLRQALESRCMPARWPTASPEIIESRHNSRLKELRKHFLHGGRSNDGLIAIEGPHLLEEALRSGLEIHSIFIRADGTYSSPWNTHKDSHRLASVSNGSRFWVAADAFDHACATESPPGIAALVQAPQWSLESMLDATRPLLIVLAGLQDPGNLGTILRTAEAFGATGVLLTPGTTNPWSQKVLRSSAGSCFRLPVVQLEDLAVLKNLQNKGIPLHACAPGSGTPAREADLRGRIALVIGNEGAGISDEVIAYCTGKIQIPCPGAVESLNAAIAAAILLYEASQQSAQIPFSRGGTR